MAYKDNVAGDIEPATNWDGPVDVIVQFADEVAADLHGNASLTEAVIALRRTLDGLNATIRPQHPSSQDPSLMGFFIVDVENGGDRDLIAKRLRNLPMVKAVYATPEAELP